jgi:hypothetical protein
MSEALAATMEVVGPEAASALADVYTLLASIAARSEGSGEQDESEEA